jgi:A/G-specific adenine glycosylase
MIQDRLLAWYTHHLRDLPWRETQNPYFIWVSEVMLQQTQVDTVIPYYKRFISRFPTLETLAGAPLQQVLKVWENLGYYSRARYLHRATKVIVHDMGGVFPSSMKKLRQLPGVGPYIAGAILSIAFNKKVPAVDANVKRVISRVFLIQGPLDENSIINRIHTLALQLVPEDAPAEFNQAIMDLGASVCRGYKPQCTNCPLKGLCLAYRNDLQHTLPFIRKRDPIPHKEMTAGLIVNKEARLLIVQRPNHGLLGGLWKFPGGERSRWDESLIHALRRNIREEVGLNVRVGKPYPLIRHTYSHFRMTLYAFRCTRQSGEPRPLACQRWKWSKLNTLSRYPFSKADRKIIEML